MLYEEKQIETIPVGPLGLIPLKSCEDLGKEGRCLAGRVEKRRESEHKTTIALLDTRKIPILSAQRLRVSALVRQRES